MIVYDEDGIRLDDFDETTGRVEIATKDVVHKYVVDTEEQGHYQTIAEYPETGGKDVEWRVTSPEEGHWETVDSDTGEAVTDFDGVVPGDLPHDVETPDIWEYGVYVPYTAEELAQMEEDRAAAQSAALKQSQLAAAVSMYVKNLALPRVEAVAVSTLYDDWSGDGVKYEKDQWVRYRGDLYHAEQAHTSQPDWTPDAAPSLYTRIPMCPDGIRLWEPPTHAENAWDKGETCHYPDASGTVYVSKRDGNTSVPGTDEWWEVAE